MYVDCRRETMFKPHNFLFISFFPFSFPSPFFSPSLSFPFSYSRIFFFSFPVPFAFHFRFSFTFPFPCPFYYPFPFNLSFPVPSLSLSLSFFCTYHSSPSRPPPAPYARTSFRLPEEVISYASSSNRLYVDYGCVTIADLLAYRSDGNGNQKGPIWHFDPVSTLSM